MGAAISTATVTVLFVVLAVFLATHTSAPAQIVLDGSYRGLDAASGSRLEIAPDPGGFRGTWQPAGAEAQRFEADRRGDQAEAVVTYRGRAHLMQITPLPYGAELALIPFNADGALELDGARLDTYLRAGISAPTPPRGFRPAPEDSRTQITARSFLLSYEFWRPQGVVHGYLALPQRTRTLMRLFPAVQLDVIWKLCLAPRADRPLALALEGQGVACGEVVAGLAQIQASGRFDAYKAEVAAARDAFLTAVQCGEGYRMRREDCVASAEGIAEAALRLETAATVLRRHL